MPTHTILSSLVMIGKSLARCSTTMANALDLTGAEFEWVLVDNGGNPITPAADVEITDAADGAMNIVVVPAGDTAGLDPDFYTDTLRVEFPIRDRSTVWHGRLIVSA